MQRINWTPRPRRMALASVLLAAIASTLGSGPVARADTPCVWLAYSLPPLGSAELHSCAPVPGVRHCHAGMVLRHRQRVGPSSFEVAAELPLPG